MNTDRRKELKKAYRSKPVIGGICRLVCNCGEKRSLMQATTNIEGLKNRFDFAMSTKSCPDPAFRAEWEEFGADVFSFEVLEELKKGELQTDREFADDVDALYEIWLEKSGQDKTV